MKELEDFQQAFGAKVTKAREAKGLSISQLGKLTGISKSHISATERGNKNVALNTIRRLAGSCEVHPKFFFEDWE